MLAAYLGTLAPERIDRTVLVAPALPTAKSDLTHLPPAVFTRFAPFIVPGVGSAVLRAYWARADVDDLVEDALRMTTWDRAALTPATRTIMRENLAAAKRDAWRVESLSYAIESLVAALLGGRELHEAVASLTSRTLVVWGDRDALVGRPVIEHLVARRPDWRTVVLPDAGHTPMLEAPDRYVAVVQAWLEARPPESVDGALDFAAYAASTAVSA
jgi:pimeloyl-ACP methyl ester carboxylesterase